MDIFAYLIPAVLIIVLAALGFGIFAMFRGGEFGRSWSNKAMRMRVLAQFAAVIVLVVAMLWKQHSGS